MKEASKAHFVIFVVVVAGFLRPRPASAEQVIVGFWPDRLSEDVAVDKELRDARKLYNERKYQESIEQFNAYLVKSSDTIQRCEAQYDSAWALTRLQFWDKAVERWTQLVASAGCPQGPQALMNIGSVHSGLGKWDDAISVYQKVVDRYPKSLAKKEAQVELIQCHYNKRDYRAYELLGSFIREYPSDTRIPTLCQNLLLAWQTSRTKNPSASVELPHGFLECPGAKEAIVISRLEAITRARKAATMKIPTDAPVDVEISGDDYVVTFKTQVIPHRRGADYYSKVWVNRSTGKITKSLVGP